MKTKTKAWLALGLGLGALLSGDRAWAANPARLNLNVSVTASLSVAVNSAASSTQTLSWDTANPNQEKVSASTVAVINDSNVVEKWALSTLGRSIDQATGGEGWTLDTSTETLPGADAYTVQAVFGSSNTTLAGCPAAGAASWIQDYAPELTTGLATYGDTATSLFEDSTLTAGGGLPGPDVPASNRLVKNSKRALCWRMFMPASTTFLDQTIQVVVTAQLP